MTQEEKELLLKDLSARLSHGTICEDIYGNSGILFDLAPELNSVTLKISESGSTWTTDIGKIKPYLRPMSAMTEDEFKEYHNIKYNKIEYRDNWKRIDVGKFHNIGIIPIEEYLDWLNSHHFDYRGLIEKGLALEAPEGMYNIQ